MRQLRKRPPVSGYKLATVQTSTDIATMKLIAKKGFGFFAVTTLCFSLTVTKTIRTSFSKPTWTNFQRLA
jgi:hypothetical protein